MTAIVNFPRLSTLQGQNAVFVIGSDNNGQTYGVEFQTLLDEIGANIPSVGSDQQIIFNEAGVYSANANLQFDYNTNELQVGGNIAGTAFNGVAISSIGAGSLYLADDGTYKTVTPTPAGADTEVQFNDGGIQAGDANFIWNKVAGILSVAGQVNASLLNGVAITNGGVATNFLDETGSYNSPVVGNDTELQFNSGGIFGSSANLTFDGLALSVVGNISGTSINATDFNGVSLTAAGSATNFLNEAGNYVPTPDQPAAGSDTQVQFNSGGSFSGTASFTFDGITLNAPQFNGVALTSVGSATDYLNASGTYTPIASQVAGANSEIQFNNAGAFGSSASLTWNGTTLNATQFNGVPLSTAGASTDYLNGIGGYSPIPVNSVFGRTGTVVAVLGDYSASLVSNDSAVSGTNVDDALDQLNLKLDSVTSAGFPVEVDVSDPQNPIISTRKVFGEWLITTVNGTITPITQNVPVKLLTGGNDVTNSLVNTTSNADNRINVNESEVASFRINANIGLDKAGGGNESFQVSIYMDGAPLPTPIFINEALGQDDQTSLSGVATGVSAGAHFFEVWIEGLTEDDDITMTTGQMWVERIL